MANEIKRSIAYLSKVYPSRTFRQASYDPNMIEGKLGENSWSEIAHIVEPNKLTGQRILLVSADPESNRVYLDLTK